MGDFKARIKARFSKRTRSITSSSNSISIPHPDAAPTGIGSEDAPSPRHRYHLHPHHLTSSSRPNSSSRLTIERHTSHTGTPTTRNGSLTPRAASRRQSSALESSALVEQRKTRDWTDDVTEINLSEAGGTISRREVITLQQEQHQNQEQQEQHKQQEEQQEQHKQQEKQQEQHKQHKQQEQQEQQEQQVSLHQLQPPHASAVQQQARLCPDAAAVTRAKGGKVALAADNSIQDASSSQLPSQAASDQPASGDSGAPAASAASAAINSGSRGSTCSLDNLSIFNKLNNNAATTLGNHTNSTATTTITTIGTNLDSIHEDHIIITTAPTSPSQDCFLLPGPSRPTRAQEEYYSVHTENRSHSEPPRRQSLLPAGQTALIRTLLTPSADASDEYDGEDDEDDEKSAPELAPVSRNMATRKIWVKRAPSGSATLVTIHEDDLVDEVRETIIHKYTNSLGRQFDAPDLNIYLVPREPQSPSRKASCTRLLGPEEPMAQTLDKHYSGGQTVHDALIIEVVPSAVLSPPLSSYGMTGTMTGTSDRMSLDHRAGRSTPRLSPSISSHHQSYHSHQIRPSETGGGYFDGASSRSDMGSQLDRVGHQIPSPEVGVGAGGGAGASTNVSASAGAGASTSGGGGANVGADPDTDTGAGAGAGSSSHAGRRRGDRPHRISRSQTSPAHPHVVDSSNASSAPTAPTVDAPSSTGQMSSHSRSQSVVLEQQLPTTPGHPTSPGPDESATKAGPGPTTTSTKVTTPPIRVQSPRAKGRKVWKPQEKNMTPLSATQRMLATSVPPINVLIVEDNLINLKLLEAFVKRLRVRWQTATNGKMAVDRWRDGGFHLVLMDIQLPVMTGLEATREIRRLEKANSIGVFTKSASSAPEGIRDDIDPNDLMKDLKLFKSPVIIVALTASSLQSDRHEALAAGCNDFLTKPVNFVWLERKVMEWGCMQALIDFAGWRRWKQMSAEREKHEAAKKAADAKARAEKRSKKQATAVVAAAAT